jgi:hypothetical protein
MHLKEAFFIYVARTYRDSVIKRVAQVAGGGLGIIMVEAGRWVNTDQALVAFLLPDILIQTIGNPAIVGFGFSH